MKYEVIEYISSSGKPYFADWFNKLDANSAEMVLSVLHRLALGHESNVKYLRNGVWEYKIDHGPGFRIYYAKVGRRMVLLLAGGTKREQKKDIDLAFKLFAEYKLTNLH